MQKSRIDILNGGSGKQIGNEKGEQKIVGRSHAKGGVDVKHASGEDYELEGGEVVDGDRVFSVKLKSKSGESFAAVAESLLKAKKKANSALKVASASNKDKIRKKIKAIEEELSALFAEQQEINGDSTGEYAAVGTEMGAVTEEIQTPTETVEASAVEEIPVATEDIGAGTQEVAQGVNPDNPVARKLWGLLSASDKSGIYKNYDEFLTNWDSNPRKTYEDVLSKSNKSNEMKFLLNLNHSYLLKPSLYYGSDQMNKKTADAIIENKNKIRTPKDINTDYSANPGTYTTVVTDVSISGAPVGGAREMGKEEKGFKEVDGIIIPKGVVKSEVKTDINKSKEIENKLYSTIFNKLQYTKMSDVFVSVDDLASQFESDPQGVLDALNADKSTFSAIIPELKELFPGKVVESGVVMVETPYGLNSEKLSPATKEYQDFKNYRKSKEYQDKIKDINLREYTSPVDKQGFFESSFDAIHRGSAIYAKMITDTPAFLYDIASYPLNKINEFLGGDPDLFSAKKLGEFTGVENKISDYYAENIRKSQKRKEEIYDKDLVGYAKSGDWDNFLGLLSNSVLESAPISISLMLGNAGGLTAAESIIGGGSIFSAGKYADLNENPETANLPTSIKLTNSISTGLAESFFEQYGITKLGGAVSNLIKGKTREEAINIAKDSFMKVYTPVVGRYLGTIGEESLGEAATKFAENAVDKYTGVDPNIDLSKDVVNSFIVGAGAAKVTATPVTLAEIAVTRNVRSEAKKIDAEKKSMNDSLRNPNVTKEAKEAISKAYLDLNQKEAELYSQQKKERDSLPDVTRAQVDKNNQEISGLEKALTDPNVNEETKLSLQERIDQLNKNTDELVSESKKQAEVAAPAETTTPVAEVTPEVVAEAAPADLTNEYIESIDKAKAEYPETFWSVDRPFQKEDGTIDKDKLNKAAEEGRLIKTEAGFGVVGEDGDIKGVFKSNLESKEKTGDKVIQEAVKKGGIKLDNFALPNLMKIYERNGFREVSRLPFNKEFAPEGWTEAQGTPDVVAMVYDPEGKLDIEKKQFTDYGEAMAYRDSYVDQALSLKEETAPTVEPIQLEKEVYTTEDINQLASSSEKIQNPVAKKIVTDAANVIKALKSITGTNVNIHSTEESYNKSLDENLTPEDAAEGIGTSGYYMDSKGEIHISLPNIEQNTIYHEAAHPVLNFIMKQDPAVVNRMSKQVNSLGKSNAAVQDVVRFADDNYSADVAKEEKIVEFIARVADGRIDVTTLNKSAFEKVKNIINEMLGLLLGENAPVLSTVDEVIYAAKNISEAFKTGREIQAKELETKQVAAAKKKKPAAPKKKERVVLEEVEDIKEMIDTKDNPKPVDREEIKTSDVRFKKELDANVSGSTVAAGQIIPSNIESSKVSDKPLINVYESKEVSKLPIVSMQEIYNKFGGKATAINTDPTRVGELTLPSGKKIFMYGGPYYTAIKDNESNNIGFATTQKSKVKTHQKLVNKVFGDSNGVTLIVTQSPESVLGNSYALRYVLDAISQLPKTVRRDPKFKSEFFGKDIKGLKDAFGEKGYNEFVSKYKNTDFGDQAQIDDMIEDLAYKLGDNNPKSFKARRKLLENLLGGVVLKSMRTATKNEKGYVSVDPSKYIAKQLLNRFGLNTEKLMYEIAEKKIVDSYMNDGQWGFAVAGFESSAKDNADAIQDKGVVHPLFNAKFPGKNNFVLDGAYQADELFLPEDIVKEGGKIYKKKASQMLAGSMYVGKEIQPSVQAKFKKPEALKDVDSTTNAIKDLISSGPSDVLKLMPDTKILNKLKEPLKVYHGTSDGSFINFERGDIGFHFGTKESAEQKGNKILQVYLNIKNPLDIKDKGAFEGQEFVDSLYEANVLSKEEYDYFTKEMSELKAEDIYGYNTDVNKELREKIKEKGYDGFTYTNMYEKSIGKSIVALYPEQVVFADGRNASSISKAYHKGKENNSNQELVKNIENIFLPKEKVLFKKPEKGVVLVPKKYKIDTDGVGNFLFYHYGKIKGDKIDPKYFGKNKYTSDQRRNGVSYFYTKSTDQESMVSGDVNVIKVPMEKVYPFNKDPLNFYDQAEANFRKDFPNGAFDAVKQIDYMNPLIQEAGFDMTVAEWSTFPLRAETTKALPIDKKLTEAMREFGGFSTKDMRDKYEIDIVNKISDAAQKPTRKGEIIAEKFYGMGGSDASVTKLMKDKELRAVVGKPLFDKWNNTLPESKKVRFKKPEQRAFPKMEQSENMIGEKTGKWTLNNGFTIEESGLGSDKVFIIKQNGKKWATGLTLAQARSMVNNRARFKKPEKKYGDTIQRYMSDPNQPQMIRDIIENTSDLDFSGVKFPVINNLADRIIADALANNELDKLVTDLESVSSSKDVSGPLKVFILQKALEVAKVADMPNLAQKILIKLNEISSTAARTLRSLASNTIPESVMYSLRDRLNTARNKKLGKKKLEALENLYSEIQDILDSSIDESLNSAEIEALILRAINEGQVFPMTLEEFNKLKGEIASLKAQLQSAINNARATSPSNIYGVNLGSVQNNTVTNASTGQSRTVNDIMTELATKIMMRGNVTEKSFKQEMGVMLRKMGILATDAEVKGYYDSARNNPDVQEKLAQAGTAKGKARAQEISEKALKDLLSQVKARIAEYAKNHWNGNATQARNFKNEILEIFGPNSPIAQEIADKLEEVFNNKVKEAAEKVIQKELGSRKIPTPKQVKEAQSITQKILGHIYAGENAGVLDTDMFINLFADKYGFTGLTQEQMDVLKEFADVMAYTQPGSAERKKWMARMELYVKKITTPQWRFVLGVFAMENFYASMLSGFTTFWRANTGVVFTSIGELAVEAIVQQIQNPKGLSGKNGLMYGFKRMLDAFSNQGWDQVKQYMKDGLPISNKFEAVQTNVITEAYNYDKERESLKGKNIAKYIGTLAFKSYYWPVAMMARSIGAMDALITAPLREYYARNAAMNELLRGGMDQTDAKFFEEMEKLLYRDKESIKQARQQAEEEYAALKALDPRLKKLGFRTSSNYIKQRTYEILDSYRDPYIQEYAEDMQTRSRLMGVPTGTAGVLYDAVTYLQRKFPGFHFVAAFARVPLNALNEWSSWSPYGLVRGVLGRGAISRTLRSTFEAPTDHLRFGKTLWDVKGSPKEARDNVRDLVKGVLGSAIMSIPLAIAIAANTGDEEEEPEKGGTTIKTWMNLPFRVTSDRPEGVDFNYINELKRRNLWFPNSFRLKVGKFDTGWVSYLDMPFAASLAPAGYIMDNRFVTTRPKGERIFDDKSAADQIIMGMLPYSTFIKNQTFVKNIVDFATIFADERVPQEKGFSLAKTGAATLRFGTGIAKGLIYPNFYKQTYITYKSIAGEEQKLPYRMSEVDMDPARYITESMAYNFPFWEDAIENKAYDSFGLPIPYDIAYNRVGDAVLNNVMWNYVLPNTPIQWIRSFYASREGDAAWDFVIERQLEIPRIQAEPGLTFDESTQFKKLASNYMYAGLKYFMEQSQKDNTMESLLIQQYESKREIQLILEKLASEGRIYAKNKMLIESAKTTEEKNAIITLIETQAMEDLQSGNEARWNVYNRKFDPEAISSPIIENDLKMNPRPRNR